MVKLLKRVLSGSGLLVILFGGVSSYAEQNLRPLMTITKTKVAPVIDGVIKPGEWKYASATTGFVDLGGTLTRDDTIVYITYDKENIYMAFRSTVPGKIKAKATKRDDGAVITKDDAIEIRLAPNPERPAHFYTFIGNSIGAIYDSMGAKDSSWNGNWRFKNSVVDSGETVGGTLTFGKSIWTAEIAVSFKDLGVSTPENGALWRVNFHRDWNTETRKEGLFGKMTARWTSWSPPVGGFNKPQGFGYLYFREQAPTIKVESLGDPIGGDINIKGEIFNSRPKALRVKTGLSVSLSKLKKEIIRKEVPLILAPHQGKKLKIKKTLELTKSLPLVLSFTVRDSTKKEILYRNAFSFTSRPSFRLDAALLYSRKKLLLNWDIKRLPKLPPTATALAEVHTAKDNILITSLPLEGLNDKNRTGNYSLDISQFTPGDYVVKIYLKDKGKMIAQTNADFIVPKKPEWWGNKLGISDKVPPPWSPVAVKGNTVSVWGREYEFTSQPFPSQIINQGRPMLSSPIRLKLVTDKGTVKWEDSKVRLVSGTANKATFKTLNKSSLIDLSGKVEVEFDGFIRVDFTLSPKVPLVIKNLVLEIPLKKEDALYMKAFKMFPVPDYGGYAAALYEGAEGGIFKFGKWLFSSSGWAWPNDFMHYTWIGGDKAGLSISFDSDENFQSRKYVEVVNKKGIKELRFSFIDSPYPLKKPLSYTLALHATPVKPLPRNPRKWHFGYAFGAKPEGQAILYAAAQYNLCRAQGWPGLTTRGKRTVKAFRKKGVRLFPDYYTNVTTVEMPEFQIFGKEWESIPRSRFLFGKGKFTSVWVSLKGSYTDFLLWGLNKMIDEGVGGIYFDSPGVLASTNENNGSGYIGENGKRKATINLFEAREGYKRIYTLFKSRDPGSFIFNHAVPISPLASFVDGTTSGESWSEKAGLSKLTADRFRFGFSRCQQYGVPYLFYATRMANYPAPELRVPAKDILPISLIHNIYPLTWPVARDLKSVWEIMDEWYTSSKWIPYWKSGDLVKSFAKNVKVSIYRKAAEKKALILVANLGANKTEGELKINLSNFGLKRNKARLMKITPAKFEWKGMKPKEIKAMTKQEISLAKSKISISLPKYSLQFFLLEKR